jgi:pyruvate dehydrogenase E2 component (dihydrolipoamide acetyltransferase)
MATQVILPALGMAQETGIIVRWLKTEGEEVAKGEPLAEIETDKATVEIEAPASGVLTNVTGPVGVDIPVGQVIAAILSPGESPQKVAATQPVPVNGEPSTDGHATHQSGTNLPGVMASPLAQRIAAEHNLDIASIQPAGRRVQKADVLAHIQNQQSTGVIHHAPETDHPRLLPASPKARRLAAEQGKDLAAIHGTGPTGAVLVADVLAVAVPTQETYVEAGLAPALPTPSTLPISASLANVQNESAVSNIWRIMAERTTQSWTSTPHFYLVREVNATHLIAWREQVLKRSSEVTYSDLLVKIVATALRLYPRVNASWHEGKVILHEEVHIGLAVAVEEGLVVPVIHQADKLGLSEITRQRSELVNSAQTGKLRPQDIQGGTFTISNLGMYGVDAFNAIINSPQAAILAVGRIAERVVPFNGQPAVQPMMTLTLSCDHRVVDGARGARFLETLATFIEDPLALLN